MWNFVHNKGYHSKPHPHPVPSPNRTYDVAETFKQEYGSDEVHLLEHVECLYTGDHKASPLLVSARGQVLQHLQQQALALVHSLGTLDHKARREKRQGREGRVKGRKREGTRELNFLCTHKNILTIL